ncbi:hypothetical protein K32_10600 [Kaistia sp. 32K]|uniref:hypothetical protein n=1 Tax=Kaistia sp. 32K TaxID=2795690 RepID=UPI00191507ED|nr:hypothetical protein [Kaistia sp. 32K]BCP52443.1 hypothetical protein K32_10600 [Kaistia sp. 32K]
MAEIVRRTFAEGEGVVAEEADWKSRQLDLDVRGWSSCCTFVTGKPADDLQGEIRKKLPKSFLQAVEPQQPVGGWVRGARWELEAAIRSLEI